MEFLQTVEQFGLAVALLGVFFIPLAWWFLRRDSLRETRLGGRLDQREAEIKEAREAHLKDLRDVVSNNTAAVRSLNEILRERPCLARKGNSSASWFEDGERHKEKANG